MQAAIADDDAFLAGGDTKLRQRQDAYSRGYGSFGDPDVVLVIRKTEHQVDARRDSGDLA